MPAMPWGSVLNHVLLLLPLLLLMQVAAADPNARYALGSVLNHVLLHQTVIGEETLKQLEKIGEKPDVVVRLAAVHLYA